MAKASLGRSLSLSVFICARGCCSRFSDDGFLSDRSCVPFAVYFTLCKYFYLPFNCGLRKERTDSETMSRGLWVISYPNRNIAYFVPNKCFWVALCRYSGWDSNGGKATKSAGASNCTHRIDFSALHIVSRISNIHRWNWAMRSINQNGNKSNGNACNTRTA